MAIDLWIDVILHLWLLACGIILVMLSIMAALLGMRFAKDIWMGIFRSNEATVDKAGDK